MRKLKHGKMSGGCGDSCCLKLEGLNVRIQGEEILEDVSFHLCLLYTSDAADD